MVIDMVIYILFWVTTRAASRLLVAEQHELRGHPLSGRKQLVKVDGA